MVHISETQHFLKNEFYKHKSVIKIGDYTKNKRLSFAQSAEAVKYTDRFSAEG